MTAEEAWSKCLIEFYKINQAFATYTILIYFQKFINVLRKTNDISSIYSQIYNMDTQMFPLFSKSESKGNVPFTNEEKIITINALSDMLVLFALYHIDKDLGDFTMDQYFNYSQCLLLKEALLHMLPKIRTIAIPLTDSFNFSDIDLNSSLGRYDGNVYENLYETVNKYEINKQEVFEGFHEYLKPSTKL